MKCYSIDRIEGTKAVLIDDYGAEVLAELEQFDIAIKEGDVVGEKDGGFVFDRMETEKRREKAIERQRLLFKRNKK